MASKNMIEQLKKPKRNLGFLKVKFNIVDPETNPDLSSNSEEIFSDLDNIKETTIPQTKNYATLEKNFWLLNDSQPIYGSEELEQTYVSSYMSDKNCLFSDKACITLTSSVYLTTLGLTMVFDSIDKNYAKKLKVKAYRDSTMIMDKDYTLSSYSDRLIFADNEELVRWNKIEIYFIESSLPYRRIRVNQLLFGIMETYTDENLISAESKEKTTMINSELPTHTFKFTIDNMNKLFNPDNPQGWYRYILQQQPISYEWGYQLDDGTIEWILGGKMLLTGSVEVGENQVSFSTTSLINYLTKVYKKGVYNSSGRSLYDLAVDVLEDSNIDSSQYNLWSGLKLIKTDAPLPKLEARQLLQIIATTGNCILFTNRENVINIQPFNYVLNPDGMSYDFITSNPVVKVQSELHNTIIYINHYSKEDNVSELFKNESLEITGTKTIEIEYDLATDISATITGGTIVSANYYGRYAILKITNTGEDTISLKVSGKKINNSQTIDSKQFNDDGENIEYKNDLITQMVESSKETKLKDFIGNWYNNRNIYSFENRGDIVKDTREIIPIETDFSNSLIGYLVENNINYDGAWSGNSVVVKVGDN
ncbi:MAG: hypothetical protein Q4C23_03050 [Mycoplasmatota bacterium]|nr:hypothetical protein [Mycoplasmatota bacterium]